MELQKLIDGLKAHRSGAASYESVDEAIRIFEAMRDVDGKKVVNGLEFCIRNQWGVCAKECPYKMLCFYTEGEKVMKRLVSDALALIQQQQARIAELEAAQTVRVMPLEAAQTARVLKPRELYEGQVIWFEGFRSEGYRSLWVAEVSKVCSDEIVFFGGNNEVHMPIHAYEERYRCWTQRPTDEQRKAVKWDE